MWTMSVKGSLLLDLTHKCPKHQGPYAGCDNYKWRGPLTAVINRLCVGREEGVWSSRSTLPPLNLILLKLDCPWQLLSFNSISFLCKAASDSSGMLVPVKDEEDKPTKIETPRENHHRKCCNNAQSRLVFWENNLHGIDQGIDEAIGSHQSLQRKCN